MHVQFHIGFGAQLVFTQIDEYEELTVTERYDGFRIHNNKVVIDGEDHTWTVTLELDYMRFHCVRDDGVEFYVIPTLGSVVIYDDDVREPEEYVFTIAGVIPIVRGGDWINRDLVREISHKLKYADNNVIRLIAEYLGIAE